MSIPVVHLIGPGGAGKTTAGALLARRLKWQLIDLDQHFLAHSGDIGRFIDTHGYEAYARRNVEHYSAIRSAMAAPAVLVTSSGFMTYPTSVHPTCSARQREVERDPLSMLLLPAFALERCVAIIVARQSTRPFLHGNLAREEQRIRARFALFMALRCHRVCSDAAPETLASEMADRVVAVVSGKVAA